MSSSSNVYVTLPPDFVALDRYPGYYWNLTDQKLYSIKITGVLKPLKRQKGRFYLRGQFYDVDGYHVSYNGWRKYIRYEELLKIKPAKSVVPVRSE